MLIMTRDLELLTLLCGLLHFTERNHADKINLSSVVWACKVTVICISLGLLCGCLRLHGRHVYKRFGVTLFPPRCVPPKQCCEDRGLMFRLSYCLRYQHFGGNTSSALKLKIVWRWLSSGTLCSGDVCFFKTVVLTYKWTWCQNTEQHRCIATTWRYFRKKYI